MVSTLLVDRYTTLVCTLSVAESKKNVKEHARVVVYDRRGLLAFKRILGCVQGSVQTESSVQFASIPARTYPCTP